MPHLTRNDYSSTLQLLARLESLAGERGAFVQSLLGALAEAVPFERACVSVRVAPAPGTCGRAAADGFVAQLTLAAGRGRLLAIDLVRLHGDFSNRDRERLALLQPHLAYLYQHSGSLQSGAPAARETPAMPLCPPPSTGTGLTRRELDVMDWLACGKTDADIGVLLAISTRTVHKHLEHIYEKLGVETRTAAVMAMRRRTGAAASRP